MAVFDINGIDISTGQFKRSQPGDSINNLAGSSTNTSSEAFGLTATSLTSGAFLRGTVPSSGFTGNIIDIKDNAGSPVSKFIVDNTGKITTGSADAAFIASGQLPVNRGGTALGSFTANRIMYSPSANTFGELNINSTLGISSGVLSVQADTVVERLRIASGGTLQGTRPEINFIQGSNITLTVADDSGNNRVNVTVAASVAAGSRWDQLSDPTTDLALTMSANTTALTWGNSTSTSNMFSLADGDSNTSASGHILNVHSGTNSTAKPIRVTAQGTANGVEMTTAGVLQSIGTGSIVANNLNGVSANGMLARTSAGNFTARTLAVASTARLTVSNGDGVSGAPTFDLATVTQGSSGTSFLKVQLDSYGRVINNVAVSSSDITTALTYTPLNKAGDSMTNFLTLHADPTSALHAATKQYVDTVAQGFDPKPTARLATAAALPSNTYNNGSSGVGATLTANANGALTVDGQAVAVNDYILVKNEASQPNNGLYVVTATGGAGAPYVLTRDVFMDSANEFSGAFVPVGAGGTANANTLWLANPSGAVTVGTTNIPFTQLNGATSLIQGNGITLSGNTISANLAARLTFTSGAIDLVSGVATPGTYKSVTVNTYGQVTGGTNPTTLAGYGITDAQGLNADLTALAGLSSTGWAVRTATNTWAQRTFQGTSNKISITNPAGIAGDPVFNIGTDVVTLTDTQTLTNKTLTSPVINVGSDATGDIYYRSSGALTRLAIGANPGMVLSVSSGGVPTWNTSTVLLSTTTGIDAKSVATTNLYTVPSGKTAIITKAIIVPTAASSITQGPSVGIGIASGEDDIFASTQLTGLTATTKAHAFDAIGTYAVGAATNIIKLGVDVAAAGTSMTISVYLFGYLI